MMRDALGRIGTVAVLGGTSDIGTAIARVLVRGRGARRVILAGRDPDALARRGEELRAAGATATPTMTLDALDGDTHEEFVGRLFDEHGDVDVVVFAVGILGDQHVAERDRKAALQIVQTNYLSAVSVGIPLAARLEEQGHGSLVVLSSVAGERPRRANFIYGSSKAGLDAFAQGLGDRFHGTGVRVLVVRPGFVHTRMTRGMDPAPLAVQPADVAREVVRGLDRGAHTVHVPPAARWLMAVLRHLPRPLFRRLPR